MFQINLAKHSSDLVPEGHYEGTFKKKFESMEPNKGVSSQ